MAFRLLPAIVLATVLLAPAAAAHSAVYSADGQVRGSVGLLNEPVSTYAVTGLDVCFYQNTTTTPRPAVSVGNAGAFQATLRAPNNETFTMGVRVPHGRDNCLTFDEPLVLTQPGQYHVDLKGDINGTSFDVTNIAAGGAVIDRARITFPDDDVADDVELARRIQQLEARIAELEDAPAPTQTQSEDDSGDEFAPGPGPLLLVGLVAFAAILRRRRL